MIKKSYEIELPLGISKVRSHEDINGLKEVMGDFGSIDFNISRTSREAFSIRIIRKRVPEARGDVIDIDETVSGLIDDMIRLTYGEYVQFISARSQVKIRFSIDRYDHP